MLVPSESTEIYSFLMVFFSVLIWLELRAIDRSIKEIVKKVQP
jgi:hypothetical protein